MFMVNATEKLGRGDQFILEHLKSVKQPVFLVINKIDLITKEELLTVIATFRDQHDFAGIIPISAMTGENIDTAADATPRVTADGHEKSLAQVDGGLFHESNYSMCGSRS